MSLDVRIQPLAFDVQAVNNEAAGVPPEVLCTVVAGLILPFATDPQGTPAVAPFANIRFGLRKADALQYVKKIQEVADELPDESDIAIATDLSAVGRMAEAADRLKGNG